MNKTKKTAVFILLTILLACSFAGCAKLAKVESTEDSTVQVKIVDEYHHGSYMTSCIYRQIIHVYTASGSLSYYR